MFHRAMLCTTGTALVYVLTFVFTVSWTSRLAADLIPLPPHSHGPSPITTFSDGHIPISTHQHQHRTGHDPKGGVVGQHIHGSGPGAAAYNTLITEWVWVGQNLVRINNPPPGPPPAAPHTAFPGEFAHGHQGHELPAGRYHVHPAVANVTNCALEDGICPAEASAWNANAAADVNGTLNGFGGGLGWLDIGNAAGPANWPGVEGAGNGDDPAGGGLPAAGTGVPWHSSVAWVSIAGPNDPDPGPNTHELHIIYGEASIPPGCGATVLGCTDASFGHVPPGAGFMQIIMDDDVNWFYGGVGTPGLTQIDFASVMLHEWGHALGLGHFGTIGAGYVMDPAGPPAGTFLRTIDPDAIHGIRDLYAIAVPEPSTVTLAGFGLIGLVAYGWRRQKRA